jgi:hypothetical protein
MGFWALPPTFPWRVGEWRREVVHRRYVPSLLVHAALYDCVPTGRALVLRSKPSDQNGPIAPLIRAIASTKSAF